MPEIEPWIRLCLLHPAIMPFVHCASLTDAGQVVMAFSELERAGWAAIVWLVAEATWKIIRRLIPNSRGAAGRGGADGGNSGGADGGNDGGNGG